jgi:DNA repair exonuclease SbcCD ATPase subunit
MSLKEIRSTIEQKKGQRDLIESTIESLQENTTSLKKEIKRSEKAQAIIQKVAQDTQSQLEYHISDIVTMALDTIFDEPYKFKVNFVLKRNKTECELMFERDGEEIDPLPSSGGGVIDVASFALRIALWTLQNPKSRNTIILDEPFKFLSKDLLPRACELLQELRSKLNLQFIIVTHLDELAECADKTFEVRIKKGVSKVF